MDYLTLFYYIIGGIFCALVLAGLQRKFASHTIVNGFMDMDKLRAICPELFKKKDEPSDGRNS